MALLRFDVTVPNNVQTDYLNTITDYYGYKTNLVDDEGVSTPNPQTRKQFLDQKIVSILKDAYRSQKAALADAARLAAISQADSVAISI